MAISKIINIDGKDVEFKSSAAIPRLYRLKFRRDLFQDMKNLKSAHEKSEQGESELSVDSLEVFENIVYIMAKHADKENKIPANPDEWLEEFNTFSVYYILPQLIELWQLNNETMSVVKKNKKD